MTVYFQLHFVLQKKSLKFFNFLKKAVKYSVRNIVTKFEVVLVEHQFEYNSLQRVLENYDQMMGITLYDQHR